MYRVRLINRVIGSSARQCGECVSGISGKEYGRAILDSSKGGPVLDMSMEEYDAAKFDIIGNPAFRQQWVPEFYEVKVNPEILRKLGDDPDYREALESVSRSIGKSETASRIEEYNELRKRAKAAGVWKPGMKKVALVKVLATVEAHATAG